MQCIGNRPKENIGEIGRQTPRLGAHVVEYPCIETEPLDFDIDIREHSWIIFTSSLGVTIFFKKLYENKLDSRYLYNKKLQR